MPEPKKEVESSVIYWAPAEKYELANFIKEKKEHGEIIVMEQSLCFHNNLCVCDPKDKEDKKKIKHIESSKAFAQGKIIKCANKAEAHKLTRMRLARKSQTMINVDSDLDAQPAVANIGSGDI